MNMQEAMGKDLPREVANKYVEAGEEILAQALGRAPETRELADFAEIAASSILGGMYDILRTREGAEHAEVWLKKTLSLAWALVRFRGSDAVIQSKVHIKDVPNKIAKRHAEAPQVAPPPALAPEEATTCSCNLDPTGRCEKCIVGLSAYFQAICGPLKQMLDNAKNLDKICKACGPSQVDFAMSAVVPTIFSMGIGDQRFEGIAQDMMTVCYQMAGTMGVREMPLTENVWREIARKQAKGS